MQMVKKLQNAQKPNASGMKAIKREWSRKEEAYRFLSGELMSGGTRTQSNKRITIFSHVSWLRDPTVTPNSRCRNVANRCQRDATNAMHIVKNAEIDTVQGWVSGYVYDKLYWNCGSFCSSWLSTIFYRWLHSSFLFYVLYHVHYIYTQFTQHPTDNEA